MNQLSLAGVHLEHFHICAFFNSRDEEYEVLAPFFKEGISQGEKILHIVNPAFADEHRARLTEAGIDTHQCEACGQLQLLPWQQAYLDDTGRFDKNRMLQMVERVANEAAQAGYSRIRVMGDMEWVFSGAPGATDVLEYEVEVNDVLARNRLPAICVYDIANLTGAMMMDLLRTHPLTLIGGVVQENPFYTPPAEMLSELQKRKAVLASA